MSAYDIIRLLKTDEADYNNDALKWENFSMDKRELTMKEKMHTCDLYLPDDEEIMEAQTLCLEKLYDFNATRPLEIEK